MQADDGRRRIGGEAALGGLLVLLGVVVVLGQAVGLDLGRVGWPVLVLVLGLGLLGLGLAAAGRLGEVLAMVGGVVTVAGVVLGGQNATDRFDTWAYAWTLVLLVGAGVGRGLVGWSRAAVTWPPAAAGWSPVGWSAFWCWGCSSRWWSASVDPRSGRSAGTGWRGC
jgi:hypothetical protein